MHEQAHARPPRGEVEVDVLERASAHLELEQLAAVGDRRDVSSCSTRRLVRLDDLHLAVLAVADLRLDDPTARRAFPPRRSRRRAAPRRDRRAAAPRRGSASSAGSSCRARAAPRTISQAFRRACGSKPVVGSSRKTRSGSPTSARPRSRRRFWPPESVFTRASRFASSPTSSITSSTSRGCR